MRIRPSENKKCLESKVKLHAFLVKVKSQKLFLLLRLQCGETSTGLAPLQSYMHLHYPVPTSTQKLKICLK